MKTEEYALNSRLISESLEHFCKKDTDNSYAAAQTRKYYRGGGVLLWTRYEGVTEWADTVVSVLRAQLPTLGFTEIVFELSQIEADLERMRNLRYDERNSVNQVSARLDYLLTKAYLRYSVGQHFGFVNPNYVLNRYDVRDRDSTGAALSYRQLFDLDMEHPDEAYVKWVLHRIDTDSLGLDLRTAGPSSDYYNRLKRQLPNTPTSQRRRIIVNMERCRWRLRHLPKDKEKYIVVNIPAFRLWAVDGDSVVDMRVACGALKTKTPLLHSQITHMEVNPEWVIPMSIVQADVARHGGDSSYFARRNYYIVEKKTGRQLSPKSVTPDMLNSGKYRVAQRGGEGNSLGRIIFRFPNNFSVFLHDTSSPGAFGRDNRGVSHGCVRVQRPFDLAAFLLGDDADEWTLDKLRITMGMKPETEQGQEYIDELDPAKPAPRLVHSLPVSPRVPLYITYYTIFQSPDGSWNSYPDVYGYDEVIGKALKTYIQ